MVVTHNHHIVASLVDERYSVIERFAVCTVLSLYDEVDRVCLCILSLEDVLFFCVCHIKIVTELRLVFRKGHERILECRSHEAAVIRAVRRHCTECV